MTPEPMSNSAKDQLLEEFRLYLDSSPPEGFNLENQPDLNTLLSEMAGLKTEVKLGSRQAKSTLDQLGGLLETLQLDNKTLQAELLQYQERLKEQKQDIQRSMILETLEVYDRLYAGFSVLEQYHPVSSLFNHSKKQDMRYIGSLKEGQAMTIKRFEQFLHRYQVKPIETLGKIMDPLTMTAVATVNREDLEHGVVIEELRKGFLLQNSVLRLAEVKVNKKS